MTKRHRSTGTERRSLAIWLSRTTSPDQDKNWRSWRLEFGSENRRLKTVFEKVYLILRTNISAAEHLSTKREASALQREDQTTLTYKPPSVKPGKPFYFPNSPAFTKLSPPPFVAPTDPYTSPTANCTNAHLQQLSTHHDSGPISRTSFHQLCRMYRLMRSAYLTDQAALAIPSSPFTNI